MRLPRTHSVRANEYSSACAYLEPVHVSTFFAAPGTLPNLLIMTRGREENGGRPYTRQLISGRAQSAVLPHAAYFGSIALS